MKKKSKGGKRAGAGRPPLADAKVNIPLRVAESDVQRWGGKNELKKKLYGFIAYPTTFNNPPDSTKIFPLSDAGIKQKAPKEQKKVILAEFKRQEQPKVDVSANTKPRTLDELKALCPAEITDKIERAQWVGKERQKYGI